jgi:hypothetical protein
MEQIELTAPEGKWLTKEPTNVWQRYFYQKVKVPQNKADEFEIWTDEQKADYERRRAEYMNQFNDDEEE